ncbi:MAG: ureidoglycolate lyase [Pseudomonadota bacterium]
MRTIALEDIDISAFAPFGELIDFDPDRSEKMNASRFDRYTGLATIDVDGGCPKINVSLMRCTVTSGLPYRIEMLERHPKGSQAFMPITGHDYVVAVAPAADAPDVSALRAFRVRGNQGINLKRGIWHLPMLGFVRHQSFLIVDHGGEDNCDEHQLSEPLMLQGAL